MWLPNRIKELRVGAGMTQAELAKKVNVDQSSLSHWEKGDTRPSRKYIPVLAGALGVAVEELGLEKGS